MVPKGFAQYENKIINGISCLYLAENKIMAEPQDIKYSKNIKNSVLRACWRKTGRFWA